MRTTGKISGSKAGSLPPALPVVGVVAAEDRRCLVAFPGTPFENMDDDSILHHNSLAPNCNGYSYLTPNRYVAASKCALPTKESSFILTNHGIRGGVTFR